MFKLYHNKDNYEISISPLGNLMVDTNEVTNVPMRFNANYFVCNDRKILKAFAEELRQGWIQDTESQLRKLRDFEIKVKYK